MATLTTSLSSSSPYPSFPANSNPNSNQFFTPKKTKLPFKKTLNLPTNNPIYPWSIPLHQKNPNSIYKDIQKFARNNKLKQALTILDYLEKLGIPVNVTTFSALIGAITREKSLIYAKQIYAHLKINGLQNNEFLKPKLVQMYVSCGSLDDAKGLFIDVGNEEFGGVLEWNALLRGNVVSGFRKNKEMLVLFTRMREIGAEMNEYSYSCMIKSFGGATAFKQGLKMHGLLVKNGFLEGSLILQTSLVDMYFKCRRVNLAVKVFDEMPERDRDVVVWGAMIAGFGHNGLYWEGIECFRAMVRDGFMPNSVVVTSLLSVVGDVGALRVGKEVHCYVFKRRVYLDHPFVKSALIDMYCKCGDMSYGRKVFYNSVDRSTVSWTALMSGYVSNGRLDQALRSIVWMQQEGFRPDVVSLATILPVCSELRALREGKEIHGYLVKNGFLPNVSLLTSLIVMYSKCGVFEYCRRLFDNMETRNVIAWTAFLVSCTQNGHPYEALEVFRSMQLSKHRADQVTMSRVLGICCDLQLLKLGKEIHAQILKKNIERIPYIIAGLVKLYGQCGLINKAKLVFDFCPSPGCTVRTAMMSAYGCNSYFNEALAVFDQVVDDGVLPHMKTFDEILAVCDQASFADEACRIVQLMTDRYKMSVSEEQYSLIAGLLYRLGRVEEAEKYMQQNFRFES